MFSSCTIYSASKCYCENTADGVKGERRIMCVIQGALHHMGSCASNEWCTGANQTNVSNHVLIEDITNLCRKGNNRKEIISSTQN